MGSWGWLLVIKQSDLTEGRRRRKKSFRRCVRIHKSNRRIKMDRAVRFVGSREK